MDEPAQKLWTEFAHNVIEPDQKDKPLLARIDLTLKKFMVIFAVNEKSEVVSEDIVHRIISMYPYLVRVYGETADSINKTVSNEIYDEVERHILRYQSKKGVGPTASEIYDFMKKKYDRKATIDALFHLVKIGVIREIPPQTNDGRASSRFVMAG